MRLPADDEGWDDFERARTRRALFDTVMDSVEHGGWFLVRTSPGALVTRRLQQVDVDDASCDLPPKGEANLAAFAPECRPAVRWLLKEKRLTGKDVERIVGTVDGFDDHVLALAYDSLAASPRKSARVIGASRAPFFAFLGGHTESIVFWGLGAFAALLGALSALLTRTVTAYGALFAETPPSLHEAYDSATAPTNCEL